MRRASWLAAGIAIVALMVACVRYQSGAAFATAEAVLQITPPLFTESTALVSGLRFEDQVQQGLTTEQLQQVVDTFGLYEGPNRVEQLRADLTVVAKDHQVILRYRHRNPDLAVKVLSRITAQIIDDFQAVTSAREESSRRFLEMVVSDRRRKLETMLPANRTAGTPIERDLANTEVEAAKENYKAALFDVARAETAVAARARQLGEQVRPIRTIHVVSK